MEFTETNKIYQIIHDKKFIDWILTPTNELEEYWNNYMQQNPRDKEIIREARVLLKEIAKNRTGLKEQEIHQLWDRIDATLANRRKQNVFSRRWLAAASILIIVGLSGWLFQQYYIKEEPVIDYTAVVRAEPSSNDVTLFLSDSSHETFSSNEVDIKYDGSGVIVTGTGKVLSSEAEKNSKNEEQLNQLVVPFGKHSSITLSDGTKLWLNSGSRAIYPVTFNKKYREIFIEGEAYLEVAQNASQPFYVKTDKINVKVLEQNSTFRLIPRCPSSVFWLKEVLKRSRQKKFRHQTQPGFQTRKGNRSPPRKYQCWNTFRGKMAGAVQQRKTGRYCR
jgi:cytoskeletal protein RodZ